MRLREIKSELGEAASWGDCALGVLTQLMKLQDAEVMALILDLQEVLLHHGEAREIPQGTRDNVKGAQERPAVGSDRGELGSECRNSLVREEIPYLEVLHDSRMQEEPYGERAIVKGEDGPCEVPLYFEKQGSLIAVAWGKPAEDANIQVISDEMMECEAAPSLGQEEVSDAPHLQMATEDAGEDEASAFFQCSPCAAGHQVETDQEDASASKLPLYEAPVEDKDGELHGERMDPQRPSGNKSEPVFSEFSQLAGDIQDQPTEEAIYTGMSPPSGPTVHETRPEDETDEEKSDQTMEDASKEPHFDIATDFFDTCNGKAERFQEYPTEDAASTVKTGTKGYQREATITHISEMEREETMKSLVDMQRKAENKCQRDKERQMFRIQERLSIIQNKKSEDDLLGHKQGDSLKELTENFKQEDRHRQKTLVKEKLEQLRRERSHVMQSKRDRNTAVFKELLDPVVLHRPEQEDIVNCESVHALHHQIA
ncbi:uncharacterized protein LOC135258573 [Anguilla rostrata]|uniref:uncharacterized protein LOC135258573 n=1 Tax=Anguilla rostrata TaxID=7938 RepID=UPI0030D210A8